MPGSLARAQRNPAARYRARHRAITGLVIGLLQGCYWAVTGLLQGCYWAVTEICPGTGHGRAVVRVGQGDTMQGREGQSRAAQELSARGLSWGASHIRTE